MHERVCVCVLVCNIKFHVSVTLYVFNARAGFKHNLNDLYNLQSERRRFSHRQRRLLRRSSPPLRRFEPARVNPIKL